MWKERDNLTLRICLPAPAATCAQQVLFVFWFLKVSEASLAAEFWTVLALADESGPTWAVVILCCHLEPRSVPAFAASTVIKGRTFCK